MFNLCCLNCWCICGRDDTALSGTCLLITFGINFKIGFGIKSEDCEPTLVSELINVQRMVKVFLKNVPKPCGKPSQKGWSWYLLPYRYVNVSELKLLFKKSIRFFVDKFLIPHPNVSLMKSLFIRTTNQIDPIV